MGVLSLAAVAWPLSPEKPPEPVPAKAVMIPPVTFRTWLFPESEMRMLDPLTPSPVGAHMKALVAAPPFPENLQDRPPSLLPPEYIFPANVLMVPPVETLRTTLLPVSEKYRFPELSTTMLVGSRSLAEVAGPP